MSGHGLRSRLLDQLHDAKNRAQRAGEAVAEASTLPDDAKRFVFEVERTIAPHARRQKDKERAAELLHWKAVLNGLPPPQQDMRRYATGREDAMDKLVAEYLEDNEDGTDGDRNGLPEELRRVAWGSKLREREKPKGPGKRSRKLRDRAKALAQEYDVGIGLFSRLALPDPARTPPPELDFIGAPEERHKPVLLRNVGDATYSDLVFNPASRPKAIAALAPGKGSVALSTHRRWAGTGVYAPDPLDLLAFGTDGLGSGAYLSESESDENDENDDDEQEAATGSGEPSGGVIVHRWSIVHRPETIVYEEEDK